jgi:TPR repeat protein
MIKLLTWLGIMLAVTLCAGTSLALTPDDIALIARAAEQGSAASAVLLAVAYENGDGGLRRDAAAAAYWFEQAALRGETYAANRIADCYAQGLGVKKNPPLAFDWRLAAADRGNVDAQSKLGQMYRDGFGVERDAAKAEFWLARAAAEGETETSGDAGAAEPRPAGSWFEQAAQRGYVTTRYLLRLVERLGYRIDEGWRQGRPSLARLAADGDGAAQLLLAQRYENGTAGVRRDVAVALDWYRQAADGGHRPAMRALARIYGGGQNGIAADPAVARMWDEKSRLQTP